jgi:UDP-N-acetylmuramoylalanine-D-glutamate ligase
MVAASTKDTWSVLEVSSFQLETVESVQTEDRAGAEHYA